LSTGGEATAKTALFWLLKGDTELINSGLPLLRGDATPFTSAANVVVPGQSEHGIADSGPATQKNLRVDKWRSGADG
jgi:hypothetical protein